jgi:hypothetical protein
VGHDGSRPANFITFRPKSDTRYAPSSTKDPSCGLDVDALPTDVGGRFTGAFAGTLHGTDTTAPAKKELAVTFDVLRER